jgi:hypothetical protein
VHWVSKLREICLTLGLMDEPRPHAPTDEDQGGTTRDDE